MLVGGAPEGSYFKPTAAVWLLHVSPYDHKASARWPLWRWGVILLVIAALAASLTLLLRKKKPAQELLAVAPNESHIATVTPMEDELEASDDGADNTELMHRICQLMEQQQLYLNPNLKLADLATALGSNRSSISNCINSQRNCSFPQFVNAYRIAHVQELLRNQPNLKVTHVWMNAGFSSEASFYRIFKSATGTTPTDWRDNNTTTQGNQLDN